MHSPILKVQNLHTWFETPTGTARAVDGVNFELYQGETLAIVGESGSGKSITALSLMQLVPEPAGYIEKGSIFYKNRDLLDLTWEEMRALRGKDIAMIFQEPMTSLNPVLTVEKQIVEAMQVHGTATGAEARKRAVDMLNKVGIRSPQQVVRQFPHELSGGMRQRVMIAIALSNNPQILLADEPTTALDVTVQAQILDLLASLQKELGMSMLLITHDLGIVARVAQRCCVMYAGQIVEEAPTSELLKNPQHPYTRGLLASLPSRARRGQELYTLEGVVPPPTRWPKGCRFALRCPNRMDICKNVLPGETALSPQRRVSCHLYNSDSAEAAVPLENPS